MAPHQSPDIKLAEVLKLAVDLLLADPGPPLDGDNEDGRADTGVIGTRKILEDREENRFSTVPTD